MQSPKPVRSLSIVIPALNEEEAIGSTIERCLAARDYIKARANLAGVEIIVVSDGSTDQTAAIAQSYDGVHVIVFPTNRGYGAAIKEGWRQASGDLLGFLDADGTCDPKYFADMCAAAISEQADCVLGARLGPDSEMPRIRRFGNRIYALLLGFLCGRYITDTASGMRVVPRTALRRLYPLPDGLHFTPAMSARSLLNDLRVIELPMSYRERVGRSKLNVIKDGVRFLRVIGEGVLCYRPERIFLMASFAAVVLIVIMALYPAEFYLTHKRLEEWMIYRFVASFVLGTVALMLLLATALSNQMAAFGPRRREATPFFATLARKVLKTTTSVTLAGMLVFMALVFLWPGIVELVTTGKVYMHWSRLIAGAFALTSAAQVSVFAVLMAVCQIWDRDRQAMFPTDEDSFVECRTQSPLTTSEAHSNVRELV